MLLVLYVDHVVLHEAQTRMRTSCGGERRYELDGVSLRAVGEGVIWQVRRQCDNGP